jgi:hypothetical protein
MKRIFTAFAIAALWCTLSASAEDQSGKIAEGKRILEGYNPISGNRKSI